MRTRIWFAALIGSAVGGFIPTLWGADFVSYTSVLLSGIGGFAGIWVGYMLG
jgi:hypothetical protein